MAAKKTTKRNGTGNREDRRAAASDTKRAARSVAGEQMLDLGFRHVRIKVSLGAIADLEDEFKCDFADIETALLKSTRNIAFFIATLARAAGEDISESDIEKIRRSDIDLPTLLQRVSAVMSGGDAVEGEALGNAPAPSA